jgi:SAGA-associated factor 73
MKIFGADPLKSTSEIGIVQCKDCGKPILRSAITEHAGTVVSFESPRSRLLIRVSADNCKKYDLEKGGGKGKADDGVSIVSFSCPEIDLCDFSSKGQEAQRRRY